MFLDKFLNLITFHNNKLIVDVLKRLLKGNHFFISQNTNLKIPHIDYMINILSVF